MKTSTLLLGVFFVFFHVEIQAQNDTGLTVHEWGTFTARYNCAGLPYANMHQRAEERLPEFVGSIDFSKPLNGYQIQIKDYNGELNGVPMSLTHAFIRMETPVLYFYSDNSYDDLEVRVDFKQGTICQFYPPPVMKEDTVYIKRYVNAVVKSDQQFNGSNKAPELNFSKYPGFAKWKLNIMKDKDQSLCTYPNDSVPDLWKYPRNTASNMIESSREYEKYIFYRGFGGFENPLIPSFTEKGNLILENKLKVRIPYFIVFERDKSGNIFIWNVSDIDSLATKKIARKNVPLSEYEWDHSYRPDLRDELIKSGLYKDEADAMLNTWNSSYFKTEGIKIFWIVPRSFTDDILPISFSRPVANLERVMIGRTEIDGFDAGMTNLKVDENYPDAEEEVFTLFPNPSGKELHLKIENSELMNARLEVFDMSGRLIEYRELSLLPYIDNVLPFDLSTYVKGNYILNIAYSDKSHRIRFNVN